MGNPKDHIYTWPGTDELVPSVTTIIHDILAAPELTEWRIVQGIIMARQNPMMDIADIQALSDMQNNVKASIGVMAHSCAQAFHLDLEMPAEYYLPEVQPLVDIYIEWAKQSYVGPVAYPEELVYGETSEGFKYAGRVDIPAVELGTGTRMVCLDGTRLLRQPVLALMDMKFSKTNRPEWQLQLEGYRWAVEQTLGMYAQTLISVRIDEAGVHAKEWAHCFKEWEAIVRLWYWRYGTRELEKRMDA